MGRQLILLPLKLKNEFENDRDYINYAKKRYIQKCNYEFRQKNITRLNKRETYPQLPK